AERLLEEIVVHSGGRERQFEVLVGHTKPLIGVLMNQRLCFSVANVESVKPKLEADSIIELPRVLQVSIDAGRGGRSAEVATTEQRNFSCILIRLLCQLGRQGQATMYAVAPANWQAGPSCG